VTSAFPALEGPVFSPSFDQFFGLSVQDMPHSCKTLIQSYRRSVRRLSKPVISQSCWTLFVSVKHETQTLLEGKLLVSNKCRVLEIKDILTWTEASTIFQRVMCSGHPHWWPDVTKYKLLIIQTACLSPGLAWLEYDLAFQNWCCNNWHIRLVPDELSVMPFFNTPNITLKLFTFFFIWHIVQSYPTSIEFCILSSSDRNQKFYFVWIVQFSTHIRFF